MEGPRRDGQAPVHLLPRRVLQLLRQQAGPTLNNLIFLLLYLKARLFFLTVNLFFPTL